VPTDPSPRTGSAQTWRSTLWVWPVTAGGLAFLASLGLARVRPPEGSLLGSLWPGGTSSASALLEVTATSVMTATTIIFSLTVLALQLASQQFSPRLLRRFARDRVTKRVLSILVAAFAFSITGLSGIEEGEPVPTLVVAGSLALAIASLAAILAFITHMVRVLRVDTMMLEVHDDTERAIEAFYPVPGDETVSGDELAAELDTADGEVITASRSGFVRMTDIEGLVDAAARHDLLVRVDVRAGDEITRTSPLAYAWGGDRSPRRGRLGDDAIEDVRAAIAIGYERTIDQDTAFGFRQLEDIAVKAISPAINDPVTAAHAVGHMADLLVQVAQRRAGATVHFDDEGTARAIVPDRDLRYYLDLTCGQLRRFGSSEPSVLCALLRALRDVGVACRSDAQRDEVRRSADAVVAGMDGGLIEVDLASVRDHRERVERALDGDLAGAFIDRAGETRSM